MLNVLSARRFKKTFRNSCVFLNSRLSRSIALSWATKGGIVVVMRYRFEQCEIDTSEHLLLVDGKQQAVEPQVFDLLRHMIENAGRLISHDELIEVIWRGRIVSDSAVSARISSARAAIGDNGSAQSMIETVPRRGFRFIAKVQSEHTQSDTADEPQISATSNSAPQATRQRVTFCTSRDGTRIAMATTGTGPPLVRAGHWLTHLEHDWQSPVWRPFLDRFGQDFQVTRYDRRGNGLSDWDVDDLSLEKNVDDLEAIVEASGLERFSLYGSSQGVPISIAYAVRHPDRVTHLILHGGYVRGRLLRGSDEEREQGEAMLTLIRHGWGKAGNSFQKAFSSMYIPDGTSEQIDSLADLQRHTTSPDMAVKLRRAVDNFDVSACLEKIAIPTLVLHARNDGVQPLDQGRKLAAGIKDAQFVMLESNNHALLEQEPAWTKLFEEIKDFTTP